MSAQTEYYHRNREKCLARQRRWREQNREYIREKAKTPENREYINGYKRQRRQDVQAVVRARKLSLGCSECGYKEHHAALEWHHPNDDKEATVSLCMSIDAAEREMAKCVVLCSNCHKIHHWEERDTQGVIPIIPGPNPILDIL